MVVPRGLRRLASTWCCHVMHEQRTEDLECIWGVEALKSQKDV